MGLKLPVKYLLGEGFRVFVLRCVVIELAISEDFVTKPTKINFIPDAYNITQILLNGFLWDLTA